VLSPSRPPTCVTPEPPCTAPLDYGVIVAEDLPVCPASGSSVHSPRREKSLGSLCHRFIAIFLLGCSSFSLDDVGRVLMCPEDVHDSAILRTKARRLYDIANVLSAVGMVGKIQPSNKKPVYHWCGAAGATSKAYVKGSVFALLPPLTLSVGVQGQFATTIGSRSFPGRLTGLLQACCFVGIHVFHCVFV
jgi:hypothetical protein